VQTSVTPRYTHPSRGRVEQLPDFSLVQKGTDTWINVAANPTPEERENEPGIGNWLARKGGAWQAKPKGYATQSYNANINHADATAILPDASVVIP
jgi:hypothetical protein